MSCELVLASSSRYRRDLLSRIGVPFTAVAPEIDESPLPGESVATMVRRLSLQKARALADAFPNHLIVGSDQAAEFNRMPVGKPGSRKVAATQLESMSGQSIVFHTGLSVLHSASGRDETTVVPTEVLFRRNPPERIARYLDLEPAFDCAGSFKSESLGVVLCQRITSTDPTALIGLPLLALVEALARFEFELPC